MPSHTHVSREMEQLFVPTPKDASPNPFIPATRLEWLCTKGCPRSQARHTFTNGLGLSVLHRDTNEPAPYPTCALDCRPGYEIAIILAHPCSEGQWCCWGLEGDSIQGLNEAEVAQSIKYVADLPVGATCYIKDGFIEALWKGETMSALQWKIGAMRPVREV